MPHICKSFGAAQKWRLKMTKCNKVHDWSPFSGPFGELQTIADYSHLGFWAPSPPETPGNASDDVNFVTFCHLRFPILRNTP